MSFSLANIPSQEGKTAIVTGANTGLGYETTLELAKKGIHVVVACRNKDKAAEARSNLLDEVDGASLEIMVLNLASLESVRSFAEAFSESYEKLDLLINNAGVMIPPYSTTEDGFELQFGVNHLGHFLLTALLIDIIPDNSESRIIHLSSIAHKQGRIHFDDLQWEESYSRQEAYSQSKLACLMFADELDRRLRKNGKHKLSVCVHPGTSLTELGRHVPGFLYDIFKYTLGPLLTHPPHEAALPTLKAALGKDVAGGDFFGPQGFMDMKGPPGNAERAEVARDAQTAQKLWQASEELTSCSFEI